MRCQRAGETRVFDGMEFVWVPAVTVMVLPMAAGAPAQRIGRSRSGDALVLGLIGD